MTHARTAFALVLVPLIALSAPAAARAGGEPGPEKSGSSHWGSWGALIGAGGGFAMGAFVGLDIYDDAINSERKINTLVAITTIGGGLTGWLVGHGVDQRRARRDAEARRVEVELPPESLARIAAELARELPSGRLSGVDEAVLASQQPANAGSEPRESPHKLRCDVAAPWLRHLG